jgi:membrane fusion protein (multidrug efflux system)
MCIKYFAAITLLSFLTACTEHKAAITEAGKTPAKPVYEPVLVEKSGVSTGITLPAQLAAYQEVSLFPKANGYVQKVWVDIGSHVQQGALLMTLEAPELQQAVLQAKEKYARSKADLSLDRERYHRLLEAAQTPGAVSPLDLSSAKAKTEADSALSSAEKANWQAQEALLAYLQVRAPFAGVITERNVHPGALVTAQAKDKPMLELKQITHLRLLVDIPENIAAQVKARDSIRFTLTALPGKSFYGVISRLSSNINAQMRSERVELDVVNTDEKLSPGMYAQVYFATNGGADVLSVPKSAVVVSTERKYVLVMEGNAIRKVDITTGNESSDRIEVYGKLKAGDYVIRNASDEIKETSH